MNKSRLVVSLLCCLGVSASAVAQSPSDNASSKALNVPPSSADAALDVLFQQAEFWRERQRADLASQALQRVLIAEPNNSEALYRLAMNALEDGMMDRAEEWEERLASAAPGDPKVMELRQVLSLRGDKALLLEQARAEAAAGDYEGATDVYEDLLDLTNEAIDVSENGSNASNEIPRSLVPEYYLTMAGDDDRWDEARQGLTSWNQRYPNDAAIATALGQVLSYREATRREGIDLLAEMAPDNAQAQRAWRESLYWLDATPSDEHRYASYYEAYPDDDAIVALYEDKIAVTPVSQSEKLRAQGYNALEKGQLTQARQAFAAALAIDDKDSDSHAGIGLVELRRDNFGAAVTSLERALALAPDQRGRWLEAYSTATFYHRLDAARQSMSNGNLDQALTRVQPLTQGSGANARAAKLLEADILKRQGRLRAAEQRYQVVLDEQSTNVPAQLGLIDVLQRQQRWGEAEQLAARLPASAREGLGDMRTSQAQALRRQASSQSLLEAESTLRRALEIAPADPWVRLDLARLMDRQGNADQARQIMMPLLDASATPEQLHAAALLASEQQRWADSRSWLARITPAKRSEEIRALVEQVNVNAQLETVQRQMEQGDLRTANRTLQELLVELPESPALRGQVAVLLIEAGNAPQALALIQQDIGLGGELEAPSSAYLGHVQVLAKAGRLWDAQALADRLARAGDFTSVTGQALDDVFAGVAVAEGDRMREAGQLAGAYDVLAQQLLKTPDNEALLLAMARLYDSGKRNTQAQQLYDYVLNQHPNSEQALLGAVNTALAGNQASRAAELLSRHRSDHPNSPSLLLARARVAQAQGNSGHAIQLLRQAQMALPTKAQGSAFAVAGNPFRNATTTGSQNSRPSWLPGGSVALPDQVDGTVSDNHAVSGMLALEQDINQMLDTLYRERLPEVNTGLEMAVRDGEEGLSQFDLVEAPVGFSVPIGSGRVQFKATPTYAAAGTPQDDALRRFGGGAITDGAERFSSSLNGLDPILNSIERSAVAFGEADAYYQTALADPQVPELERVRLKNEADRAKALFDDAASQNVFTAIGIDLSALNAEQRALLGIGDLPSGVLDSSSLEAFQNSREQLELAVARSQGLMGNVVSAAGAVKAQEDAGMALELAYRGDSLDLDIGSTPLGFEETNLVGGLRWHPNITDNTELSLTAERRAIKDSLLSYAGTQDNVSGKSWGGVVKTGGKLGIAHDNEDSGLYGTIGAYRYTGTNVADNHSVEASLGGYVQALRTENSSLQTGVHVNYMDFDENLSKYSFGHGGYFSPQNHVSVAFPVSYRHDSGNMRYTASITPGYQSYSEQASDYFPTDNGAQEVMDLLANIGVVPESRYGASSKSGFGMSLGAGAEYQLNDSVKVGAKLGYDTFGDYNETSGMLYMNYQLDITQ